jgi:uncharacterized protein YgiM (DUF1202 family)
MKKFLLPIVVTVLLILIIGLIVKSVFFKNADAGLRIESIPQGEVFLNGQSVGKTPFESEKLTPGEKTIKIVPDSSFGNFTNWETKIKLTSGAMSLIKREFAETDNKTSGEIVTFEKTTDKKSTSLLIISIPDSVVVKVNGESRGFTPVSLDKLSEGEYEITLSAPGFNERIVNLKLFYGFKSTLNVKLSAIDEGTITPTPTPAPITTGTVIPTPSSKTPTPSAKITPIVTKGPTPTIPEKPYILINETPTGWLRVRSDAAATASEIGKVYPGETYALLDEKSGWIKINYKTDTIGWVSGQYVKKVL